MRGRPPSGMPGGGRLCFARCVNVRLQDVRNPEKMVFLKETGRKFQKKRSPGLTNRGNIPIMRNQRNDVARYGEKFARKSGLHLRTS